MPTRGGIYSHGGDAYLCLVSTLTCLELVKFGLISPPSFQEQTRGRAAPPEKGSETHSCATMSSVCYAASTEKVSLPMGAAWRVYTTRLGNMRPRLLLRHHLVHLASSTPRPKQAGLSQVALKRQGNIIATSLSFESPWQTHSWLEMITSLKVAAFLSLL